MTTVVSILLSDIIPLRERGVWQGIINIIYATGAGVGAPLGKGPGAFPLNSAFLTSLNRWYLSGLYWLEMVSFPPTCQQFAM